MKKISALSIGGIVMSIACLAFALKGFNIIADAAGMLAFFLLVLAIKQETLKWQIYAFVIAATIFGFALSPKGGYYALTASMFFVSLVIAMSLILYEKGSLISALWPSFVCYIMAICFYVGGNIFDGSGWVSWVFPIPALVWGTFIAFGFVVDIKEFRVQIRDKFGIEPGNTAPVFTLPDQEGNKTCIADYKGKQHVLVIFVRGDWCPTCHIMLRTYERFKEKFAEKNIAVLAIGPDPTGVNKDMVQRLGLDYKVLSDDNNTAARAYGMMFQGNNPMAKYKEGIPLPAAFLVDINGRIAYTSNPRKPGEVLKPDTIFPVVEKLQVA